MYTSLYIAYIPVLSSSRIVTVHVGKGYRKASRSGFIMIRNCSFDSTRVSFVISIKAGPFLGTVLFRLKRSSGMCLNSSSLKSSPMQEYE